MKLEVLDYEVIVREMNKPIIIHTDSGSVYYVSCKGDEVGLVKIQDSETSACDHEWTETTASFDGHKAMVCMLCGEWATI